MTNIFNGHRNYLVMSTFLGYLLRLWTVAFPIALLTKVTGLFIFSLLNIKCMQYYNNVSILQFCFGLPNRTRGGASTAKQQYTTKKKRSGHFDQLTAVIFLPSYTLTSNFTKRYATKIIRKLF